MRVTDRRRDQQKGGLPWRLCCCDGEIMAERTPLSADLSTGSGAWRERERGREGKGERDDLDEVVR